MFSSSKHDKHRKGKGQLKFNFNKLLKAARSIVRNQEVRTEISEGVEGIQEAGTSEGQGVDLMIGSVIRRRIGRGIGSISMIENMISTINMKNEARKEGAKISEAKTNKGANEEAKSSDRVQSIIATKKEMQKRKVALIVIEIAIERKMTPLQVKKLQNN